MNDREDFTGSRNALCKGTDVIEHSVFWQQPSIQHGGKEIGRCQLMKCSLRHPKNSRFYDITVGGA